MANSNSNFVDIFPYAGEAMNQEHSSTSIARYNRNEKPVTYTLKFQSFSLLKDVVTSSKTQRFESQIFNAGGYKWKLALYPNGDEKRNGSDHISIYLVVADDDILPTSLEVKVVLTFLVYNNLKDKYLTVEDGKIRRFSANRTEWGIDKLVPLETFNDPSNGFLVNDFCVFGVDICVMKCDDGKGEVFSLIKQPKNNKYTWKVYNFCQQNKTYYKSDPFNVEDCCWKICLYPKGDSRAKRDYLSLYVELDNLKEFSQGFQVYVEFEMAILSDQLGTGHEQRSGCNCWFGSGQASWGYRDFISLTKLKDPTKGFICKDTIIVEVKINVISTIKKIG